MPVAERMRKRFRGWMRLLAFLALVQAGALLLAVASARAEMNEMMMDLGARMMRYAHAGQQDSPRRLLVNGLALGFATGTTRRSVGEVLDDFHARCRRTSGRLAQQIDEVVRRGPDGLDSTRNALPDGTLRYGNPDRGFVACLDLGVDDISPREILQRVDRFLQTGELSALGGLRYAAAERGEAMTSFITFWTEGKVNLLEAFPSGRDAPGRDAQGVPRPPGSVRVLSAREQDRAPALSIYRVASPGAVELDGFYRRILPENGWQVLETPALPGEGRVILAERGGRAVMVSIGAEPGEQRYVVVSEMNGSGATSGATSR